MRGECAVGQTHEDDASLPTPRKDTSGADRSWCAYPHYRPSRPRDGQGESSRCTDQDALGARLAPRQQLHLGEGNAERFRKKAAQGPVGLAVHGRRLDPHPKLVPLGLDELVAAPPGLDPQTELEVIPHPAIPIGACLQLCNVRTGFG